MPAHSTAFWAWRWRSNGELAQELKLPLPIEVIAFSEEEGVRFGVPFIGSRAVAGRFDPRCWQLKMPTASRWRTQFAPSGSIPGQIDDAVARWRVARLLRDAHRTGAGARSGRDEPSRRLQRSWARRGSALGFTGHANHAGTTPMRLRRDALAGAAEWIGAVESLAQRTEGLVATVGKIDVEPNAGNVIAGRRAREPRSAPRRRSIRDKRPSKLCSHKAECHRQRGAASLSNAHRQMDQPAVPMDERLTAFLAERDRSGRIARKDECRAARDTTPW